MGCNLKKYRSSHLFAPLTSMPMIGTKTKKMKDIANNGNTSLIKNSVLTNEMIIMISTAKKVKIKCFVKKK